MRDAPDVPESVRRKASALGREGQLWLVDLGSSIDAIAAEWGIDVGETIAGGSGAYVARAVTADGVPAILKLAIPDGLVGHRPFASELDTLLLGKGRGFVAVLRADRPRRAMLLECLGRPLGALRLPVEAQIDVVTATLPQVWRAAPEATWLRTGADQASFLSAFVAAHWEALEAPCDRRTHERAQRYAHARHDAFDASRAVLIHGDAHPGNILEDPGGFGTSAGFKLIDPDGMRSEPAHDLAIPLRDWTDELLASDPLGLAQAWCARLGARTGVDPRAIWEWAFLERVSTGLFLLSLGDERGRRFLEVADRWAAAEV